MLSGYVEQAHINNFDFDNQRRTFHIMGYAVDPSTVDSPSSEKPKWVIVYVFQYSSVNEIYSKILNTKITLNYCTSVGILNSKHL